MTEQTLPEIVSADVADVVLPEDCFDDARRALAGLPVTVASAPVGPLRTTFVTLDGITPTVFELVKQALVPVRGTGVVSFSMGRTGYEARPVRRHDPFDADHYRRMRAESDAVLSGLKTITIDMAQAIVDHEQAFIDTVMEDGVYQTIGGGGTEYAPVVVGGRPDVTVTARMLETVRSALGHMPIVIAAAEHEADVTTLHPDVSALDFGSIQNIVDSLKGIDGIGTICMAFPREDASAYNQVMDVMMDRILETDHSIPDMVLFMNGHHRRRASEYVRIKETFDRFERIGRDLPENGFDHRAANSAPRSVRGGRGGKGRRR
jgi:hypothetical protein